MSIDYGLDIAQSLTKIVVLYRDLEDEALHHFADKDIPGGSAMVMLGPVANMEAYGYKQLSEMMGRTSAKGGEEDEAIDLAPPLLVLASWVEVIRDHRGLEPATKRATIVREADTIRASIDWMIAEDHDGIPNFIPIDELAKDLRQVRAQLEKVLKAGEQRDRGVPCMTCGKALLKVWASKDETEAEDRWRCEPCDKWSTVVQYNLAVQAAHRANSDRLNATDMLAEYRIKQGTLTGWAAKGLVSKRGKDRSGRILYDVADAIAQRDRSTAA